MDNNSDFQQKMVEYLEGVHKGELFGGSLEEVQSQVKENSVNDKSYTNPTQTLPIPPPLLCPGKDCIDCSVCTEQTTWWDKFYNIVDDLLSRSNYHKCQTSTLAKNSRVNRKGCLNSKGQCRARFPREIVKETLVEPLSGALCMKKGEAWINTFTATLTYLMRCNTDVTSLLSGTAIKAIVAYVTEYVSKPGLTTYSIFDTVRQVFCRNSELLGGNVDRKQAARSLMTKMVNALTAKIEIGSPMASLYLLGNPDHYTQHKFITFYWKNFVYEARKTGEDPNIEDKPEKVILIKNLGRYVGLSNVYDYIFRPIIYKNLSLYDWICRCEKKKCSHPKKKECKEK
jgi:hypothetical protein